MATKKRVEKKEYAKVIWTDPLGGFRIIELCYNSPAFPEYRFETQFKNHLGEDVWVPNELLEKSDGFNKGLLDRLVRAMFKKDEW